MLKGCTQQHLLHQRALRRVIKHRRSRRRRTTLFPGSMDGSAC